MLEKNNTTKFIRGCTEDFLGRLRVLKAELAVSDHEWEVIYKTISIVYLSSLARVALQSAIDSGCPDAVALQAAAHGVQSASDALAIAPMELRKDLMKMLELMSDRAMMDIEIKEWPFGQKGPKDSN